MCDVLIVDDEPGVRRLLALVLRESGCDVRVAADAESAMRLVEDHEPDVLLADVRLPGIDGLELVERIQNDGHHHHTRMLVMSAYGRPRTLGGLEFLPKPFNLESVVQAVAG